METTLLVSDLHLCSDRPEVVRLFLEFLDGEARDADRLFILGDLFEYYIGDDELEARDADPALTQVACALRALSDSGTAVCVMHGNRDFLLGARFASLAGASLLDDPHGCELAGEPTLLLHGDSLCIDDRDYMAFRSVVRAHKWQREFLARSLASRRAEAASIRDRSEREKRGKSIEIMDVNAEAVREIRARHGVRRLVHGHTHRMGLHRSGDCERWVLPDWYEGGGCLRFSPGGPEFLRFSAA